MRCGRIWAGSRPPATWRSSCTQLIDEVRSLPSYENGGVRWVLQEVPWLPTERGLVSDDRERAPRLPPRWFIRLAWSTHRAILRMSGGRVGLWRPKRGRWGTARLTTIGRRTGQQRSVVIGYFEDGPNVVTLAMNGWADAEPAWWLNLQAHPDAIVDLVQGSRPVRARAAEGEERSRLWARWRDIDKQLDAYAALRSSETAVVILEPRSQPASVPAPGRE
jgi:F420H(2)-dependent quinone reductase